MSEIVSDTQQVENDNSLTEEELQDLEYPSAVAYEVSNAGQDFDVEGLVRRLKRGDIAVPSFGDTTDTGIETAGFQRGFVWNRKQMDRFIESLLLGYPIPGIFLVRQSDGRLLVLDGQQRLRTLELFYSGSISGRAFRLQNVAEKFKGLSYSTLSERARRNLDNTFIQATIVTARPDISNMEAIYQIFERLNSGGTQLTAHEIRIALYAGPMIDFLEQLNRTKDWRELYGPKNKRVRDQELIARILALFLHVNRYTRPLKTFLNSFLDENHYRVRSDARQAGKLFEEASKLLNESVGPKALRRASRQVNNALTDSLFVGIMKRLQNGKPINRDDLNNVIEKLRGNEEYQAMIVGPSADESYVAKRIQIAVKAFE